MTVRRKPKLPLLREIRAAAALEFALVAPVLIVMIMGIAQLGLIFFANAGLNNAIAQGARHAPFSRVQPRRRFSPRSTRLNSA